MKKIKEWMKAHKVSIGLVGTSVVLSTGLGQCVFTPDGLEAPAAVEAPVEAVAPVVEAPEELEGE